VAHEVRCPVCGALQFIAAVSMTPTSVADGLVAIKCWRRTCKRLNAFRIA
jgi:phage FluMu protein Com